MASHVHGANREMNEPGRLSHKGPVVRVEGHLASLALQSRLVSVIDSGDQLPNVFCIHNAKSRSGISRFSTMAHSDVRGAGHVDNSLAAIGSPSPQKSCQLRGD